MADNLLGITSGLFGVTPTQQSDTEYALKNYKGLTSADIGAAQMYAGGASIGRGLMQAAGVEDPEMASANRAKQIAAELQQQGVSMQSSQGMKMLAQKLSEAGDFKAAQGATALAANFEDQEAQTGLKQAQTFQAVQKGIQATREKDPEIIRLQNARDALEQQFGPNDRRVLELNRILEGKAKAGQTTINMPDSRGKAFEGADTETLKKLRTESSAASGQLALISQARENLPTAVVGQGLPAVIRGLNSQLAPLGINVDQVASTRNLEQALKSIIAQGIKQYGANPSTVDLQFAVQAAADIQDPQKAIAATLQYLENRARRAVGKQDAAEQWLLNNNTLAGFEKAWTEQESPKAGKKRTITLKSGKQVTVEE